MMNRRGLLTGLGALIAAPAIVRAGSLMPVRRPPLTCAPMHYVVYVHPMIIRNLMDADLLIKGAMDGGTALLDGDFIDVRPLVSGRILGPIILDA